MSMILIWILISTVGVSVVSLIGALYFLFREAVLNKYLPWWVAFATGALLGASFLDLIPESFASLGNRASIFVLMGILVFLLFEQVLHWHHEHKAECGSCDNKQVVGYAILLGDGLHNFLDGVLIASAFLISVPLGLAATLAIFLHEIPQELGDFAVLIYSGFTKQSALLFNFLSALLAILGGVLGYFALSATSVLVPYVVAIGAGGFLYIALVDLLAEFKHADSLLARFGRIIALLIGILLIYLATLVERV